MTMDPVAAPTSGMVDIAIVGAGMLGTPLAIALADNGWSVTLIDQGILPAPPTDSLDQRCTALAASTISTLKNWGLWQAISPNASLIQKVHVSHKGNFGATRLHAHELGVDALGAVVENRQLLHDWQTLVASRPIKTLRPARLVAVSDSINAAGDAVKTMQLAMHANLNDSTSGQEAVQARLVIATDGVNSFVRHSAGIAIREVDYEQAAIIPSAWAQSDVCLVYRPK